MTEKEEKETSMLLLNDTHDLFESTVVIHPIFDLPEQKLDPSRLGPMKMTISVRVSLYLLRFYLLAMVLLVVYRMLELAGVFK